MPSKTLVPRFTAQTREVLPGSEKAPLAGGTSAKPARAAGNLTVSVIVRRKTPLNIKALGKDRLTRARYRQQHAADPAAVNLVLAFAKEFGLTVDKDTPKPGQRTLKLTGTLAAMQKAFPR